MSDTEIKYPEEFVGSHKELVHLKDGKKYFKTPVYKLSHYTYEEIKHEKIELPEKLPDIVRSRRY